MIRIRPTDEDVRDALDFAMKYDEGGFGKNVLGVSHEEYIEFIRIGKLCELALVRYLAENGVVVECAHMLMPHEGESRMGADFILTHSGQEVDVKAANKPFHTRMLIREDQFRAYVHDIYIGAKYITKNIIVFYGYTTGEAMARVPPKDFGYGLCRHISLNDLKPIERFMELCIDNKPIS